MTTTTAARPVSQVVPVDPANPWRPGTTRARLWDHTAAQSSDTLLDGLYLLRDTITPDTDPTDLDAADQVATTMLGVLTDRLNIPDTALAAAENIVFAVEFSTNGALNETRVLHTVLGLNPEATHTYTALASAAITHGWEPQP